MQRLLGMETSAINLQSRTQVSCKGARKLSLHRPLLSIY